MRRQRTIERMEDRCVLASVSGTVIDDLDGVVDPDDPGMGGVSVFIDEDEDGMLDVVGTVVEPDDFGDGGKIEEAGMTFSMVDENNVIIEGTEIVARIPQDGESSTGDLVFGAVGTRDRTHFAHSERLRVDFDTPVNSVTIDFIGDAAFATDVGTLEIYSIDDTLLGSVDSRQLAQGEYETLRLESAGGDIAYAVSSTKRENGVKGRLDALRINDAGSEISTLTNSDGEYEIQNLAGGRTVVTQVVPVDFVQTVPVNQEPYILENVGENEDLIDLDFVNIPSDRAKALIYTKIESEPNAVSGGRNAG
jgi:hypothetical protein